MLAPGTIAFVSHESSQSTLVLAIGQQLISDIHDHDAEVQNTSEIFASVQKKTRVETNHSTKSDSMSIVRHESETLEVEGEGTWIDWIKSDPARVRRLVDGAVNRLQIRYPTDTVNITDSDDGSKTKSLRRMASAKLVMAANNNWPG